MYSFIFYYVGMLCYVLFDDTKIPGFVSVDIMYILVVVYVFGGITAGQASDYSGINRTVAVIKLQALFCCLICIRFCLVFNFFFNML